MADGTFKAELAGGQTRTSAGILDVLDDIYDGHNRKVGERRLAEIKKKNIERGSLVYFTTDKLHTNYKVIDIKDNSDSDWSRYYGLLTLDSVDKPGNYKFDVSPYRVTKVT